MTEYCYYAYGIGIRSEIALPELCRWNGAVDVTIRLACPDDGLLEAAQFNASRVSNEVRTAQRTSRQDVQIYWPHVGRALIRKGREIVFNPEPSVSSAAMRLRLLGSALGVLLHQRGRFCLHASSVAIGGCAVAILGDCGMGKSSTAAALCARGHDFIADDLTTVDLDSAAPTVMTGIPQFKLWPETVVALDGDPTKLSRLIPEYEKRAARLSRIPKGAESRLFSLFVLDEAEEVEILPMAEREGWLALMSNWYGARFGNGFLNAEERRDLFARSMALVEAVPIFRLGRPDALSRLPHLAQQIESHIYTTSN